MRFSIRELLWLTTVVALVATVFTDRQLMRRQQIKWESDKAKILNDSAAAVDAAQRQFKQQRHENAILRHQVVVQMEKQIELERQIESLSQRKNISPPSHFFRPTSFPDPFLPQPVDAER